MRKFVLDSTPRWFSAREFASRACTAGWVKSGLGWERRCCGEINERGI